VAPLTVATYRLPVSPLWVIFDRHHAPPVTVNLPQKAEMQEAPALLFHFRAEAAVNAMASGSQHSTMRAISHRMARLPSVSAPISSAT
jgi:hypothetical protein